MKRLVELRRKKGKTQNEIARFLGVHRTTYVKYERGDSEPNLDTVLKLADYFNTTTDYILGRTEKTTSKMLSAREYLKREQELAEFIEAMRLNHEISDNAERQLIEMLRVNK